MMWNLLLQPCRLQQPCWWRKKTVIDRPGIIFRHILQEQGVPYYNFNREYYGAYGHDLANYVDYDGHMNGDSARAFSKVFGETVLGDLKK